MDTVPGSMESLIFSPDVLFSAHPYLKRRQTSQGLGRGVGLKTQCSLVYKQDQDNKQSDLCNCPFQRKLSHVSLKWGENVFIIVTVAP